MKDARIPSAPADRRPVRRPAPLLDRLGATGSLLCAIHCALLPLVIVIQLSLLIADQEQPRLAVTSTLAVLALEGTEALLEKIE